MSRYNDIDWENEETKRIVLRMITELQECARSFTQGHWSFLGPGFEKKCYATHVNKPEWECEKTAEGMMLNFAESAHPVFRASSAIEREELKSTGKGVTSIHFTGSDDTIELIIRTVISVNQLGVYGAVADLCGELARDSRGAGKPAAIENLDSMVFSDRVSFC